MKDTYIEDFRRAGREVIDWIARYLENPRTYPVVPRMRPGELVDSLPASGPEFGETYEAILRDFEDKVMPAVTHWNHPRFFAYFGSSSAAPAVLAEAIAAALNTNGIHWLTSPAVSELEQVALSWYRQWLGLPDDFTGFIYDTASVSTLHGIAGAREMAQPEAREEGYVANMTLYCSEQAHSSVEKGAIALGIGRRNVRKIATDAEFRMIPDALEAAIRDDIARGLRPFCIVATIGTTSTTSIDPVPEIAAIARRYGAWLHVDAAYAGSAAIVPEHRYILAGCEHADSFVVNAHKWLLTPLDCSVFFTRRPDIFRRAFSLVPEYLRTAEDPRAVNLMEYGIPLGRRFRALKLWFVMRYFGRQRIAEVIREHIELAREFAAMVDSDSRFERLAPVPFSVVCFRYRGTDEENAALLARVNASGQSFLSHTELNGRYVLRMAVGNLGTTREDVAATWDMVRAAVPVNA
jgi:aromatic-L-amino-acid decarboxylase